MKEQKKSSWGAAWYRFLRNIYLTFQVRVIFIMMKI